MERILSPSGRALLKQSEGYRSHVYRDIAGFQTIAWGHRLVPGESYPDGVTEAEGDVILEHDIVIAEASVNHLVSAPLTQGQFDALVDFVYNLGGARLATSTLLNVLNAGKYDEAAHQLLLWDHAGHVEVPALKVRREAEFKLWKG